ncbi:hypothetical protein [Granulibacter bethesdensis]|uniref:hypothetical protein n=1 Tax=Granulibacter bethesdensis TaxID=364410 RepID=UPI0009351F9F|nr:hypothetical protein [Granulibacter bethesdensis]
MAHRINSTQSAFLIACFAVTGLTGLMATYALPVPFEAAVEKETVLEHAAAGLTSGNQPLTEQILHDSALRSILGKKADAIISAPPQEAAEALLQERDAIRSHALGETQAVARRMRLLVVVATAAAALFGIILSGLRSRQD